MTALDDFITDARKIPLEDAFAIVGGTRRRPNISGEEVGPCPCCLGGGKDRFSLNIGKQVWSCRHYDRQGGDGLELIAHKHGLDLRRRAEFLLACSIVQGERPIPEGGERETDAERQARETRNAEARAASEAKRAETADKGERERQKAISQGRGIYRNAGDGQGSAAEIYLRRRTGADGIPLAVWENLRFQPKLPYFEGRDDRGHTVELHCGPGLVAPLVDLSGRVTGCHQTWIDLGHAPKYRPALFKPDGQQLPTKKMRGHKRGSIIPVHGDLDASRWVVGEGIETVLAIAAAEGFESDTFYAAAGDLGNLCGPADPSSSFNHPTLKTPDSQGRFKPVRVAGPVPKVGCAAEAFQLPAKVHKLVLLADGDSDLVKTAAAMARAEARLAREGLSIGIWWPPEGGDWADVMAGIRADK